MVKLQILSEQGVQWISWCKQRLFAMTGLRNQLGLFVLKRSYILPDNILAQIISSDICDIIRIWQVVLSGIICHPRSQNEAVSYIIPAGLYGQPAMEVTAIKGGWATDEDGNFVELTTQYAYPLVDGDNASFLLSGSDDVVDSGEFLGDEGNYGNFYWHNNEPDSLSVISYKGTPTRHFMLTRQNTITGAEDEFAIDGEGICIYKGGVMLAYTRMGTDGKHERVRGIAELDGDIICCTTSGVSIFQNGAWIDIPILGWLYGHTWFFDSTGRKAINAAGSHILTFVKDDEGVVTGTQSLNYIVPTDQYVNFALEQNDTKTIYNYTGNADRKYCFELTSEGDIASLNVNANVVSRTEYYYSSSKRFSDFVVYGGDAEYVAQLVGPDNNGIICAELHLAGGGIASPPGVECGPMTYSFGGATQIESSGCAVIANAGCYPDDEEMTVSVTINGPGFSAFGSKTFTVAARAGHWSTPGICSLYFITGNQSETDRTTCDGPPAGFTVGTCTGELTDMGPTYCDTYEDYAPGGFGALDGGHVSSQGTYTQYIKMTASTGQVGVQPPCGCEYATGATYANIVEEATATVTLYYWLITSGDCTGEISYSFLCDTVNWGGTGIPISYTSKTGYNTRAGTVVYTWICT